MIPRRSFLSRSLASATLWSAPQLVRATTLGLGPATAANSRIQIGLIGIGAMGNGHLSRMLDDPGATLVALCEVDRTRRDAALQRARQSHAARGGTASGFCCAAFNDHRALIDLPGVDAVLVATPDHWHSPQSLDATVAGKDVYCEKPVSLSLAEGRALADAVRRHGRVFQTGTQYRSIPTIRQVCEFIRRGGLGQVRSAFTLWGNLAGFLSSERFRPYAGAVAAQHAGRSFEPLDLQLPPEPVPQGLDWDRWVGPAPERPYNHLFHTNPSPGVVPWSFCADFGAAAVTWYHSHAADVIQYALGQELGGPIEILHPADGHHPTLTCRYPNGTLLHLVEHWGQVKELYRAVPNDARLQGNFGGLFVGERGWITTMSTGGPIEGAPEQLFRELAAPTREVLIGANDHHANWLRCIRTRQQPSAHAEIGHRGASLGHLTILAYRLGRSLRWDPIREEFPADTSANQLRARVPRAPYA